MTRPAGSGGAAYEEGAEPSAAFRDAVRMAETGKPIDGETHLLATARVARDSHGTESIEYRAAANDLGLYLLYLGQHERAVEAFEQATALPAPTSDAGVRGYLTHQLNLGQALDFAGRTDEAVEVLGRNAEARRIFYGEAHPGYAYLLEPLGALRLRQGRANDALPLLERAVAIFRTHGHPRIASALAWRAFALKALNRPTPPFSDVMLPPETTAAVVREIVSSLPFVPSVGVRRSVLGDAFGLVAERLGEDHPAMREVLAAIADTEAAAGPGGKPKVRLEALRRTLAYHERRGEETDAVLALQALALAQTDAGDVQGAWESYRAAVQRAEARGDMALLSRALLNYALFLNEGGRGEDAERLFKLAVAAAGRGQDDAAQGRASGAYGIFLQHAGRGEEALEKLDEAVQRLPPAHPDALAVRAHRSALRAGQPCPCEGGAGEAYAAAYREFVLALLPDDLVSDVTVTTAAVEGANSPGVGLEFELAREPNPEEQELINRVLSFANAEFPRSITQRT